MNFLDQVTRDERELLASLPYRVGFWMSQCDDSGGDESDEQEAIVLNGLIEGFAREVFGAELTQYIMMDTVANKARWEEWGAMDFKSVPEDCRVAKRILSQYGDDKDVRAFAHHLVEIAEAVAMSFSEYQYASIFEKIRMYYVFYKESFKAKLKKKRYKSLHEFLSISKNERAVLEELADALGFSYN